MSTLTSDKYMARGVSSSKADVHQAISQLDKGLFPNAFCKILPDLTAGDSAWCNILHADTAGTKTSLAYIYWKETGDISVWKGIAQDAIVMNLDDMACVGCTSKFLLSNTITRNRHLIPGEVINAVIEGTVEFCNAMSELGIDITHAGGETADVGDIVRTIDVGFTAFGRIRRDELVVNQIRKGDIIIGLASDGQATYETEFNSGIGSNGLTSARHDVLSSEYKAKYPESFSPEIDEKYVYSGKRTLTEEIEIESRGNFQVGKLLLSPTRTFIPILKTVYREFKDGIHGVIHNTGGGLTKVSKFMSSDLCAIKDSVVPTPTIFNLIQSESGTSWEEMFRVFNMGCRLELYISEEIADQVIGVIGAYDIHAQRIGRVVEELDCSVRVDSEYGMFDYRV